MNTSHSERLIEPTGIKVLSLLSFLVGLPVTLLWAYWLPESGSLFNWDGMQYGGVGTPCLAVATLSGFVAGSLVVTTGAVLLIPRWKRYTTAARLMMGAGGAALAMGVFALAGALMGRTRAGLLEATMMVIHLPIAVVLFLLIIAGVWYLRRPAVHRYEASMTRDPIPLYVSALIGATIVAGALILVYLMRTIQSQ